MKKQPVGRPRKHTVGTLTNVTVNIPKDLYAEWIRLFGKGKLSAMIAKAMRTEIMAEEARREQIMLMLGLND